MNAAWSHRGAAPVGLLADLGAVEAEAVRCLRSWSDGPAAWERVCGDLVQALGPDRGRRAAEALEAICDMSLRHGRRPLMRRPAECRQFGADEACFAHMVAAASEGEREDALMIALVMLRPDISMPAVALAQEAGLALRLLALRPEVEYPEPARHCRLH